MGGQKFLISEWSGLGSKRDSRLEAGTEPDGRAVESKGVRQRPQACGRGHRHAAEARSEQS